MAHVWRFTILILNLLISLQPTISQGQQRLHSVSQCYDIFPVKPNCQRFSQIGERFQPVRAVVRYFYNSTALMCQPFEDVQCECRILTTNVFDYAVDCLKYCVLSTDDYHNRQRSTTIGWRQTTQNWGWSSRPNIDWGRTTTNPNQWTWPQLSTNQAPTTRKWPNFGSERTTRNPNEWITGTNSWNRRTTPDSALPWTGPGGDCSGSKTTTSAGCGPRVGTTTPSWNTPDPNINSNTTPWGWPWGGETSTNPNWASLTTPRPPSTQIITQRNQSTVNDLNVPCSQPFTLKKCDSFAVLFGFDRGSGRCQPFFGCIGTWFPTMASCQSACERENTDEAKMEMLQELFPWIIFETTTLKPTTMTAPHIYDHHRQLDLSLNPDCNTATYLQMTYSMTGKSSCSNSPYFNEVSLQTVKQNG